MKKTMKCASSLLAVVMLLAGCGDKAPATAGELMERVKAKNFDNYALVLDYGFAIPDVMELSMNMDMRTAGNNARMDMSTAINAAGQNIDMDMVAYSEGATSYIYVPALDTWTTSEGEELSADFIILAEEMTDAATLSEEGNSYLLTIPLDEMIQSSVFADLLGMFGSDSVDNSVISDELSSLFASSEMKVTYDKKTYEPQYIDFDVNAEGISFMMHGEFSDYGEIEEDDVAVPEEAKAAAESAVPEENA